MANITRTRLNEQVPPMVIEGQALKDSDRYNHRSIETLVVVLAVITIVGVMAGILARLCGGRHFGGSGEHDIEGWVESKCRSCIDGGITAEDQPKPTAPTPAEPEKK